MKKDRLICFRCNEVMQEALKKRAKEENRSLSLLIEIALTRFLRESESSVSIDKERRRYPRKVLSVPAFVIHHGGAENSQPYAASVVNISLAGVKISLSKDIGLVIPADSKGFMFKMILILPDKNIPVCLECEARRVDEKPDRFCIGASFEDADFQNYKLLQSYLM